METLFSDLMICAACNPLGRALPSRRWRLQTPSLPCLMAGDVDQGFAVCRASSVCDADPSLCPVSSTHRTSSWASVSPSSLASSCAGGAVERHRVGLQQRLPDAGPFIRCGRIAQQDFPQALCGKLAVAARAMLRIDRKPRHRHPYACFFGRPPLAPFARAAAALAGDVTLPPAAPSCAAIQRFVP